MGRWEWDKSIQYRKSPRINNNENWALLSVSLLHKPIQKNEGRYKYMIGFTVYDFKR